MKRILLAAVALLLAPVIAHSDECAPSRVIDLTVAATGYHSVQLTFTDAGDDCLTGTAASYEIRISASPITESNYYSATVLVSGGSPAGSGGTSECIVPYSTSLLACSTTYYFAITFTDSDGNRSPVSNSPSGTIGPCNVFQIPDC